RGRTREGPSGNPRGVGTGGRARKTGGGLRHRPVDHGSAGRNRTAGPAPRSRSARPDHPAAGATAARRGGETTRASGVRVFRTGHAGAPCDDRRPFLRGAFRERRALVAGGRGLPSPRRGEPGRDGGRSNSSRGVDRVDLGTATSLARAALFRDVLNQDWSSPTTGPTSSLCFPTAYARIGSVPAPGLSVASGMMGQRPSRVPGGRFPSLHAIRR